METPLEAESLLRSARAGGVPPEGLPPALLALWLAEAGRWDEAHDLTQDLPDPAGAWIHAYLHRVEGDLGNAAYWYNRAGQAFPKESLAEEWTNLAQHFGESR